MTDRRTPSTRDTAATIRTTPKPRGDLTQTVHGPDGEEHCLTSPPSILHSQTGHETVIRMSPSVTGLNPSDVFVLAWGTRNIPPECPCDDNNGCTKRERMQWERRWPPQGFLSSLLGLTDGDRGMGDGREKDVEFGKVTYMLPQCSENFENVWFHRHRYIEE